MIKKLKQTAFEKILLVFVVVLAIIFFGSLLAMKNKCLFVKNYNPQEINFLNPKNIAILNVQCGNVIIELYPNISPNSVERFKMLIKSGEYNDIAFHRVLKNVLVQAGDLEFGKKNNLNYTYIGTGKSRYGTIKSELENKFDFKKGTVALARTEKKKY